MRCLADRFWAKVDKAPGHGPNGECWQWLGRINPKSGYPDYMRDGGVSIRISHVAMLLDERPRPNAAMKALHSCDNKRCVRPGHLRWGTDADNLQDHLERRTPSKRWMSDEAVREIRAS